MNTLELFKKLTKIPFLSKTASAENKLASWINDLGEFPQNPKAAVSLMRMLNHTHIPEEKLIAEISKNEELTNKITGMAKELGALEANDLMEAILSVGSTIVRLEIEKDIAKQFAQTVSASKEESLKELFDHALNAAVVSRVLATWVEYPNSEHAFFANLLKDFDQVMIALKAPKAYEKIQGLVGMGTSLKEAQFLALGFDGSKILTQLFKTWSLPNSIIDLAKNNYEVKKVKEKYKELAVISKCADSIAKAFSDKDQSASKMWAKEKPELAKLGIKMTKEEWADEISVLFVKALEFRKSVL